MNAMSVVCIMRVSAHFSKLHHFCPPIHPYLSRKSTQFINFRFSEIAHNLTPTHLSSIPFSSPLIQYLISKTTGLIYFDTTAKKILGFISSAVFTLNSTLNYVFFTTNLSIADLNDEYNTFEHWFGYGFENELGLKTKIVYIKIMESRKNE